MARMSVDDMVVRDTKFDLLAEICGWSRRETVGCMFEIWALCYDRVTPNVAPWDLDVAARRNAVSPASHPSGFAAALVESKLGRVATKDDRFFTKILKDTSVIKIPWRDQEWRDRVYVCGAADRIGYLLSSKEYGALGGHKSAESKSKSGKGPSRGDQSQGDTPALGVANLNLTSPSPSSVVLPDPVLVEDLRTPAKPARTPKARKRPFPSEWEPNASHLAECAANGVNATVEAKNFRDYCAAHGKTYVDYDAAFNTRISNAIKWAAQRGSTNQPKQTGLDYALAVGRGESP